ncbi:MAG: deoxyribose-phosphate aldolase, partial [Spirochaetaceae bacterium]|nr:deoxyribose-phosphate aldolase [Spirochaetaceae bacterium]
MGENKIALKDTGVSARTTTGSNAEAVARTIDHTQLKPDATMAQFDQLCEEAKQYKFKSVCVNSSRVEYVAKKLQGTDVLICAVVGFPLGAMTSKAKAFETREAISAGADEIDMVINIGALKSGDYKAVEEDIRSVRRATRATTVLKVIIETSMLTQDEKVIACELAEKAGADYVKTSTGFGGGGATVEDVSLMRRVVSSHVLVKASGGIRDFKTAQAMLEAGASRLGIGSSIAVMTG